MISIFIYLFEINVSLDVASNDTHSFHHFENIFSPNKQNQNELNWKIDDERKLLIESHAVWNDYDGLLPITYLILLQRVYNTSTPNSFLRVSVSLFKCARFFSQLFLFCYDRLFLGCIDHSVYFIYVTQNTYTSTLPLRFGTTEFWQLAYEIRKPGSVQAVQMTVEEFKISTHFRERPQNNKLKLLEIEWIGISYFLVKG